MHTKRHLSFSALRKLISKRVLEIEDIRQDSKVEHELHDCCLNAFAMMFFQDPSMNSFQERLQDIKQANNLKTIFNVLSIPKSTQLRAVLDSIPSTELKPLFADFFRPPRYFYCYSFVIIELHKLFFPTILKK